MPLASLVLYWREISMPMPEKKAETRFPWEISMPLAPCQTTQAHPRDAPVAKKEISMPLAHAGREISMPISVSTGEIPIPMDAATREILMPSGHPAPGHSHASPGGIPIPFRMQAIEIKGEKSLPKVLNTAFLKYLQQQASQQQRQDTGERWRRRDRHGSMWRSGSSNAHRVAHRRGLSVQLGAPAPLAATSDATVDEQRAASVAEIAGIRIFCISQSTI